MDAIYAPWRSEYIRGQKQKGCIFCKDSLLDSDFVLHEGLVSSVMMNRYPYSCGHLLIIPARHVDRLSGLDADERLELMDLLDLSVQALAGSLQPDGYNVGMNLGKIAGAGVDDHIHIHIVPRWNGDTNFMTVSGHTRVISEDIMQTRDTLRVMFAQLSRQEV